MSTKIINISLPTELVILIDARAKQVYATRSEYIKHAIMARLKSEGVVGDASRLRTMAELRDEQLAEFLKEQNFQDNSTRGE